FLMIFLAVTLGFFAESIRESISDSAKEKEYIVSMIEDAKTDTLNISNAIASNRLRALHLDSLVTLCMSYTASANNDADIYRLYNFQKFGFRSGIRGPLTFSKTDSSLRLLDNDKIKLVEFANYVSIYEGIVNFYLIRLQEMNEHAAGLIESLKKAYHLEKD